MRLTLISLLRVVAPVFLRNKALPAYLSNFPILQQSYQTLRRLILWITGPMKSSHMHQWAARRKRKNGTSWSFLPLLSIAALTPTHVVITP